MGDTTQQLTIGWGSGVTANGQIDEVMLFNRELNQTEIEGLYNMSLAKFHPTGTFISQEELGQSNNANVSFNNCSTFNTTNITVSILGGAEQEIDCSVNNIEYNPAYGDFKLTFYADALGLYSPTVLGDITIDEWYEPYGTLTNMSHEFAYHHLDTSADIEFYMPFDWNESIVMDWTGNRQRTLEGDIYFNTTRGINSTGASRS